MSLGRLLALSALTATLLAPAVQAQTTRPTETRLDRVRPVTVTPGRPTVVDRGVVRPRGDRGDGRDRGERGDRGGDHLRERLRNACFNEPNPPAHLCRRVFGDQ